MQRKKRGRKNTPIRYVVEHVYPVRKAWKDY